MIILDSVTKKFGAFTAVDNVSYTIKKGEFFALLGPNGAGKTTIVRMLLDFIKPSSGSITINGQPASDPASRNYVGYIAEQHMIPPYLSGFEFLSRHASLIGLSGKDAEKEVYRVLEIVAMKGPERKKSATYSRGMKQRIGLGAALLGKPTVLILDEPITGLDPIGIRDVRKILENLSGKGVTVILNSHLLSEVEKTCETAAIIYKGKILIKDNITAIVKDHETLEDVFIRYIEHENE
ncbi:MAG: ATP-binding cassette domain-containing protein [Proteobacteria bacterium]|jgi:ABC-2 type transport system ATP-binding protein|nr:ATP-binding cassette domain-containing protein [Pseudomonadota bacterium]MBW2583293.1 ATP-binding cassette domain-containing protein [Deltaproteobacteria bacterium]MBW2657283.1 ATP-binding cassette domain-containing protein [Deltaproteobacteria bacterium]